GRKVLRSPVGPQRRRRGHYRTVRFGALACGGGGRQAYDDAGQDQAVNQFFEAAKIALGAIWANKLRTFLTVLGNIVAVTSIIAVVSLVQGMNEYVTNVIVSDVGADNFTVQRFPVVRTQEDEERTRNNPRITIDE